MPNFPEPVREDKSCVHLQPDNSCAIYDSRPDMCRIDKTFKQFKKPGYTWSDYVHDTLRTCKALEDLVEALDD